MCVVCAFWARDTRKRRWRVVVAFFFFSFDTPLSSLSLSLAPSSTTHTLARERVTITLCQEECVVRWVMCEDAPVFSALSPSLLVKTLTPARLHFSPLPFSTAAPVSNTRDPSLARVVGVPFGTAARVG